MGRHKYIPQYFCVDCGVEIFREKRGSMKFLCHACAEDRKKLYHKLYRQRPEVKAKNNAYLRQRYAMDSAFRERKLELQQDWREKQKGTNEI
jgi:hypothetical protein